MGSSRFWLGVADENSKCIQHDFPRLCGHGPWDPIAWKESQPYKVCMVQV